MLSLFFYRSTLSTNFYFPFFLKINKKNLEKKKKKNKQCYHCFFIDRLCRLLSIFRPGQDAKLIVFFFFFKINKEYKKKK